VVTADSRVVAAAGDRQYLRHAAEVGNRMLAILRSLEDQHATGFLRLRFEAGAVAGASLGRHALVADVGAAGDDVLVAMLDEIRAILADHDLAAVTTQFDPHAAEPEPVTEVVELAAVTPPPLVGARFAGAGQRGEKRQRRSRFGSR
jgi:hypothetical protein